jgi:ribosomal protein L37AE/L43A
MSEPNPHRRHGGQDAPADHACPACGAELEQQAGIGVCRSCAWYQRHPAD